MPSPPPPVRPRTSGSVAPRRLVITGSSGLYGRAVIRAVRASLPESTVLGIDTAPPATAPPDTFVPADIRGPRAAAALAAFRPDTVVHLAFAVQPGRDAAAMQSVNLDGTAAILAATAAAGAERLLVASSATVYGPAADGGTPRAESAPLRPQADYYYAAHKGAVERQLEQFAAAHPRIAVSWTRPAIVCEPGVRNFLADIFLTLPFLALPDGADTPLQFVHADDLARATLALLAANARGPFNVAPADAVTQRELAEMMRIPVVALPFWMVAAASRAWWTLRLPWVRTPPGLVHYLRHPWLVDSSRLTRELEFAFGHSSREAFATLLHPRPAPRSRGA